MFFQEEKSLTVTQAKSEDLKAPASVLVPKQSSTRPAVTESGLYVFPGPAHPVVKSSTPDPVITIKDIHDMKAKIENLARSLKSALGSGTKKKAPTFVNLHDGVELRLGERVHEELKIKPKTHEELKIKPKVHEDLKIQPKPIVIQDILDTVEVNQLTENLRKKREDFRNVLAQNLNVRRPRMKKSDDRYETETERLQQWLRKIPPASSAPHPQPFHKRVFSGSSSEMDRAGNFL